MKRTDTKRHFFNDDHGDRVAVLISEVTDGCVHGFVAVHEENRMRGNGSTLMEAVADLQARMDRAEQFSGSDQ